MFAFLAIAAQEEAAAFSPATLSLTGWWRASYSGSPWTPTASAGSSGSNGNLSEATNPPSTGSAVNGLTPADFDGTNDLLEGANSLDTFINVNAHSGWALLNIDAISTDNADPAENPAIATGVSAAHFVVSLRSSGLAVLHHFGSTAITAAFSTGAWQLVQWKYDGTNYKIRVNSGAWSSGAASDLASVAANLRVGQNYDGSKRLDGRMLELALTDTTLSDANFDNVKSYVNSRYALSL